MQLTDGSQEARRSGVKEGLLPSRIASFPPELLVS
jgi:hypothetical protein